MNREPNNLEIEMLLEKISINAFGKLSRISLEFHPGFNLIYGPNEAGKTTLQQAILHLLYGFYQSSRATAQETTLLNRFKPWQAEFYSGQLWYQLKDGGRYNVNRNFSDSDVPTNLYDSLTGEEVTKKFNVKRHGNISFLKEQIGLTKDLFESTVFVRQGEVKAIAGSSFLVNEVIGVIDSGNREKSAKQAISHLQHEISKIGSDRAQKRPYPLAKAGLKLLKEEFDVLISARQELKQAILEKNKLEKLITKDNLRRIELNYLILTKNIGQNEKQLNRLQLIKKEIAKLEADISEFDDVKMFPEELHDSITRRRQNRKNYGEQLQEKQQNISELEEKVELIRKDIKHIKKYESIYSLMSYSDFVGLKQEWQRRKKIFITSQTSIDQEELTLLKEGVDPKFLYKISELKPADFNNYQQKEEEIKLLSEQQVMLQRQLDQLESQTWAKSKLRNVLLFSTFFITLSVLLLSYFFENIYGYPVSAGVMVLGLIVYQFYKKARLKIANLADNLQTQSDSVKRDIDAIRNKLQGFYQQYEVDSLNKLMARRMQNEQYLRYVQEKDKAFQEMDRIEFQLLKYLHSVEINKLDEDILDKVDTEYKEFNDRYKKIESYQLEIAQLKKNILNLESRLSDNNSALLELFSEANIKIENLLEAEVEFDKMSQRRKQLNKLKRDQGKYKSEINGILASRSEEEIRKESEDLIRRRELLLANYPEIPGKQNQKTVSHLEKDYSAVDVLCRQHEKDLHTLQTQINTVLEQHRPQAEIEEEIAQITREVDRLEKQRTAMESARDILAEVAQNYHRNVVPFINSVLSATMKQITNKRYSDVCLNPENMSLNLVLPEIETLGSADVLSLGTQEQLYLLLRIALARLLCQNSETVPLLLDDPFVHFDQSRMANMLAYLADLSKENQILLFTKEPFILDWCKKELGRENCYSFDLKKTKSKKAK